MKPAVLIVSIGALVCIGLVAWLLFSGGSDDVPFLFLVSWGWPSRQVSKAQSMPAVSGTPAGQGCWPS